MPAHVHTVHVNAPPSTGNADSPADAVPAKSTGGNTYATSTANTTLATGGTGAAGSNQPVAVVDPCLGLRYCIVIEGVFPSSPQEQPTSPPHASAWRASSTGVRRPAAGS